VARGVTVGQGGRRETKREEDAKGEWTVSRRHVAQLGIAHGAAAGQSGELAGAGYPRPLLRRDAWTSLDGPWDFALDADARWTRAGDVRFEGAIRVPFAPETPASGVGEMGLFRACWYRRDVEAPPVEDGERVLLHFGAVDYDATVWIDGAPAARHEGGYTPFTLDVTRHLDGRGAFELVVRAEDDPADLAKPRGKQDWQLEPHSIWYPRTTGIWQTVWFERVARACLAGVHWTPNLERWELGFDALVDAPPGERLALTLRLSCRDIVLAEDRYAVVAGEVHRRIGLSDPGIDDFRNELLWSPARPRLVDAELELCDAGGRVLDRVSSYTALRSFQIDGDRFVLNGRPYTLRMVLDQGYWPDTGLTPPSDDALKKDVTLTKRMGFNGARKHQKIEDPRYYFWADHLGLLVWAEMPSAYRYNRTSIERVTRQWSAALRRDASHPCIVAWVPFNESWGVPNLPESKPERHYVEALYHLTKTLDPTRPVVGNDGWESVATDVLGIHDYDDDPARLAARYAGHELVPKLLKRERPGGRALVVGVRPETEMPLVLSEFGGIAFARDGARTWGYSRSIRAEDFAARYAALLRTVRSLDVLAGFCYTQLADTYQEANGLLYADRTPKIPLETIRAATGGPAEHPVAERDGAPP
jgi:hypothetical protein